MLPTFVAIALVASLVLRGDPRRLGEIEFRRLGWILSSFVLRDASEMLFSSAPPRPLHSEILAFACYAMLFYGLYPNLRLPGIWLVAVGSALNFLVIVANQGRMPVSITPLGPPEQAREAVRLATSINHQLLGDGVRLRFLADLFKWSFLQPRPVMFSAGDVLIALGVSWLILRRSLPGFPPQANDARID